MSDIDKLLKALKPIAGEGGLLGKPAPSTAKPKKGDKARGKRRR